MTDLKCLLCPHSYLHAVNNHIIRELESYFNIKVSVYDIDAVVEVGKRFGAILEWKRWRYTPDFLPVPAHEYVALKKLGKSLKTTPYIIHQVLPPNAELIAELSTNPEKEIYESSIFYVVEVDRFENGNERRFERKKGKTFAIYSISEAEKMDFKEFTNFFGRLILDADRV